MIVKTASLDRFQAQPIWEIPDYNQFNFDPRTELKLSSTGVWQWTNPNSPFAKQVHKYFFDRREDGL